MRAGHVASARPMAFLAACEQPKQEQKQQSTEIIPLPRSACAQQAAEDQAQIESCNVDQLALEDVVMLAQMGAPHAPGVVAVSEAAFHQFAPPPQ